MTLIGIILSIIVISGNLILIRIYARKSAVKEKASGVKKEKRPRFRDRLWLKAES
jgi:hypothetical protein